MSIPTRGRDMMDACWEWSGARNPKGYGVVGHEGRTRRVHRLVFAEYNDGAEPEVVRHTCDNPPCFNPRHLLPGTHADNVRDCIQRGRRAHM